MALNKYKFLLNCYFRKFPQFFSFRTYPDTSQELYQWNSVGLSGNYLWKLEEKKKKSPKCTIRSRKNCIKVRSPGIRDDSTATTHTHAHTDTHTISKYHHLGISKNVENGKLLDVVFLESREDSWKNKGLWYWNPKFQAHFPHLRGMWLLVTLIFLTFRFIFYKIKIIRLHYKVVIRIEWDNMKTLNEKLGVWNVRTFLNNRHM